MNSIIEAQVTLREEQEKEIQRCRDNPHYMYLNYFLVNGEPPKFREQDVEFFSYWKKNSNIIGIIDLKGGRSRRYPISLDEEETKAFEEWRKNNKPKTRRRK